MGGAMAETLALKHGDAWLSLQTDKILKGMPHYDLHVKKVLPWVNHSAHVWLPQMNAFGPISKFCTGDLAEWHCTHTMTCNCSRTPKPATWHVNLKGREFEEAMW